MSRVVAWGLSVPIPVAVLLVEITEENVLCDEHENDRNQNEVERVRIREVVGSVKLLEPRVNIVHIGVASCQHTGGQIFILCENWNPEKDENNQEDRDHKDQKLEILLGALRGPPDFFEISRAERKLLVACEIKTTRAEIGRKFFRRELVWN